MSSWVEDARTLKTLRNPNRIVEALSLVHTAQHTVVEWLSNLLTHSFYGELHGCATNTFRDHPERTRDARNVSISAMYPSNSYFFIPSLRKFLVQRKLLWKRNLL